MTKLRMLRAFLEGAVIAALLGLTTYGFAQVIGPNALSGNECWNAGQGPGGPSTGFLCANVLRNSTNITPVSGSGAATTTGTGGTLIWIGTAPTTWTVTLPAAPANGTIQRLMTNTTLTTKVTVQAGGSDTLNTAVSNITLTADTTVKAWQYNTANTTWYVIQ